MFVRARRVLVLLSLLLLAVFSTACGSGYSETVEGYANRVHEIMDPIIATAANNHQLELFRMVEDMVDLEVLCDDAWATLSKCDVPERHKESHAYFLSAMKRYSAGARAVCDNWKSEQGLRRGAKALEDANATMNTWLRLYTSE